MSYPSIVPGHSPAVDFHGRGGWATSSEEILQPPTPGHMFHNMRKIDPWIREQELIRRTRRNPTDPLFTEESQPFHFAQHNEFFGVRVRETPNKPPTGIDPNHTEPRHKIIAHPTSRFEQRISLISGGSDQMYRMKGYVDTDYGTGGTTHMFDGLSFVAH
jgi:hypothetical protein